jgi:hypothetical protein
VATTISWTAVLEHARVRELVEERFGSLKSSGALAGEQAPTVVPKILIRNKELDLEDVITVIHGCAEIAAPSSGSLPRRPRPLQIVDDERAPPSRDPV